MKVSRLFTVAFLTLIGSLIGACKSQQVYIQNTGDALVQAYNLSGFDRIEVSHMFEVEISQGDSYNVIIEVDESLSTYLEIVTRGKTLKVGLKPGVDYSFENYGQRAEIRLPKLSRVAVTNKCSVLLGGFDSSGDLEIIASDFSSVVGEVHADRIDIDISGHSSVRLNGSAQEVTGDIAGQSSANLRALSADVIAVSTDQHSQIKE